MTWLQSIITAVIEGLTEFLPISSTAHMKIAQGIMGMNPDDAFVNMFDIVIQLAAILAVIVLYWKKFVNLRSPNFYIKLVIAVIPALVAGALLKKHIDKMLGNLSAIAVIMIIGGVLLLFIDRLFTRAKVDSEDQISNMSAFKIGCFQILSILFPGLSRSAATIVGGMASGLTRRVATEFSFFLAVPTMAAATAKELWDTYKQAPQALHDSNLGMLGVGCAVSFIVSLAAIRFFIGYVQKHSFRAFGVYRIIAGIAVLLLIWKGVIKTPAKEVDVPDTVQQPSHPLPPPAGEQAASSRAIF